MSTLKKAEGLQEKPEKKTSPTRTARKEPMIYIGPTVPGTVISGTVFNNGYPVKLKAAMETQKALSRLMIPASGLAKARQELKKTGSILKVCYEKVKEER